MSDYIIINMKFIVPSKEYLKSYYNGCLEMWNNLHNNYIIHNPYDYENWKGTIFDDFKNNEKGINLPEDYVPSTTFWIVSGDEYIGTINIRFKLNEKLKKYGGHIGIAIRPSKQNNIYGYKASLWAYKKARELNISPILVTCYKSDKASLRLLTSKYSDYFKSKKILLKKTEAPMKL